MKPHLPILCLLVLFPSLPATAADVCEPSESASEILLKQDALRGECGLSVECWERQRRLLEEALEKHPREIHLHRPYQSLIEKFTPSDRQPEELKKMRARYQELVDEHPSDPLYLYLSGRLAREDKEAARAAMDRALAVDPAYPWAHLGLAHLGRDEKDKEAVKKNLVRFTDLCPARIGDILSYSFFLKDPDFWTARLTVIRKGLADLDLAKSYKRYPTLWQLQFRTASPAEHARIRGVVGSDLERLETLGLEGEESWWKTLKQGYELTIDSEKMARAEAKLGELRPCAGPTVKAAFERWEEQNPKVDEAADPSERERWRKLRQETVAEWLERCPKSSLVASHRFLDLSEEKSTPLEDLIAAAEYYISTWEEDGSHAPTPYYRVAAAFVRRDYPEPAPELLLQAQQEAEKANEQILRLPGLKDEIRARLEAGRFYRLWRPRVLLGEAWIQLGQLDETRKLLRQLDQELASRHLEEDAGDPSKSQFRSLSGQYWRLEALLAEKEGQKLDALAFYHRAHSLTPKDGELQDRAAELWRELGGSDASWRAFSLAESETAQEATGASAWEEKGEVLTNFEMEDLTGNLWRLGDHNGKTVFANVWATWCAPCRKELPYVEELHKKLRDDPKTTVVTLNIDQNLGLVAPYMEKFEFTFPVLFARSYMDGLSNNPGSVPLNWIIDAAGQLRKQQQGFDPEITEQEWMTEVMGEIEKVSSPES